MMSTAPRDGSLAITPGLTVMLLAILSSQLAKYEEKFVTVRPSCFLLLLLMKGSKLHQTLLESLLILQFFIYSQLAMKTMEPTVCVLHHVNF